MPLDAHTESRLTGLEIREEARDERLVRIDERTERIEAAICGTAEGPGLRGRVETLERDASMLRRLLWLCITAVVMGAFGIAAAAIRGG